uniref:Vacuolar ATPase assembly protein VMA22 n=1 Tax=Phallusia mammillata TaxID=59560 RepID=A0A6F9D907_9ASCI|nr:coiled-coil domain-containing protein 115-like [Phallusia mammillata]
MAADKERELDFLCLTLLELVAEIHEKKQEQEKCLQDGFLCLAKARYALGVDRVSKLHYAAEMTPNLFVDCSKSDGDHTEEKWDILKCVNSKFYESQSQEPTDSTELRRRRRGSEPDSPEDDDKELDALLQEMNVKEKPKVSSTDPLRWFAVLAPQSLRQAQTAFTKAAHVSCEICTLRNKLDATKKRYADARRTHEAALIESSSKTTEDNTAEPQKTESTD